MIFKNKPTKIVLIGNLIISDAILKTLLNYKEVIINGIISTKKNFNSDYYDLRPIAKKKKNSSAHNK